MERGRIDSWREEKKREQAEREVKERAINSGENGGGLADEWKQAKRRDGWEKERDNELTLMVVSSEDVTSIWPFWLNWQCSTVLVCPSREARTFPVGTSSTWREEININT